MTYIQIYMCDIILIHIRGPNTYYVHACNIQTYDIHMCMSCDILVTYMLVCLCAYILICKHVTHILILFMSATCLLRYLLSDCVFYIVKKRTTLRLHSLRDWVTGGLHKYLKLFFFEIFVYSWFWRQGLAGAYWIAWSYQD